MVVFVWVFSDGGTVEWLCLFGLLVMVEEWLYGCVCLVCC
jgi:hypothetical protein